MKHFFLSILTICTLGATEKFSEKTPERILLHPTENLLSFDQTMSSHAGAKTLLFLHKGLEKIEVELLSKASFPYEVGFLSECSRMVEMLGFWLPTSYFTMVVQHEVFGHGAQIRELQSRGLAKVNGYKFGVPPLYGKGGGLTYYMFYWNCSMTDLIHTSISGIEGTHILAQRIQKEWIQRGKIDPRQICLHGLCNQDLFAYALNFRSKTPFSEAHDLVRYINLLNYVYPDATLEKHKLEKLTYLSLLDPFTIYNVFAMFKYLGDGNEMEIPMIASCYLPGLHLSLTPFGPEGVLNNYLRLDDRLIHFYLKYGSHAKNHYEGLGVEISNAFRLGDWEFGGSFHLWRQPKLLFQAGSISCAEFFMNNRETPTGEPLYSYKDRHTTRYGGAFTVSSRLQTRSGCGVEMELGYKTKGYLSGYSLRASPIIQSSWIIPF